MTSKIQHDHQNPRRRTRPGEARAWLDGYLASMEAGAFTTECVMWPFSSNGGKGGRYPQAKISVGRRMVRLTRYICERVIRQPLAAGELVRHSCDNPRCINPWHFEIGDHFANMRDMVERKRSAAGERNRAARLSAKDVRDIRQLVTDVGLRHGDLSFLARGYGVTPAAIHMIVRGKTWKPTSSLRSR